jgi:hypothetical protein
MTSSRASIQSVDAISFGKVVAVMISDSVEIEGYIGGHGPAEASLNGDDCSPRFIFEPR